LSQRSLVDANLLQVERVEKIPDAMGIISIRRMGC
jgi:hypothetical protein